jgi:hypothetical protein
MQIPADKAILYITKVSIILISISPVDCSRAIVLLLGHDPDIALDLFGVLVVSYIVDLKIPNIGCKFGLDDINRDLPPISNI